jgi:D-glycero-D-manno-heptose 1,7-bisphosphate phosphatase
VSEGPLRRTLFLDRDGVVNVEKNYVHRVEDFEFMPGIFDLCSTAVGIGYLPVVVTNQAGIGRGYYSEDDFQRLTAWMLGVFRERGIDIARVYHCPYHPTEGLGEYRHDSYDRKPNPGMLLKARDELALDLRRSVFVGDKESDMLAGRAAGVGHLVRLAPQPCADGAEALGVVVCTSLFAVRDWLRDLPG